MVSFALRSFLPQERAASTPGIAGWVVSELLCILRSKHTFLAPIGKGTNFPPSTGPYHMHYAGYAIPDFFLLTLPRAPYSEKKEGDSKLEMQINAVTAPFFSNFTYTYFTGGYAKFSRVCKSSVYRFKFVNVILDIYSTLHNKIL